MRRGTWPRLRLNARSSRNHSMKGHTRCQYILRITLSLEWEPLKTYKEGNKIIIFVHYGDHHDV